MQFNNLMIFETDKIKSFRSSDYNYIFNKETGYFARWGKTKEDDPLYGPSPEIADIEITTKCSGLNYDGKDHLCAFCYKSNTPNGKNMSFETFKKMIDKFPTYRSNFIILTLNNNRNIVLHPEQKVRLKDGVIKKALDLKDQDDIVKII